MRLTTPELEDHVASVALLLERFGVNLDLGTHEELLLQRSPSGARWFAFRGLLPGERHSAGSIVGLREIWRPTNAEHLERAEYAYELLDHELDFRRAFHLHDAEAFVRRFQVVVHEHCERPIGTALCDHLAGSPVKDAYKAVTLLLDAWVDPAVPDCAGLPCLEDGDPGSAKTPVRRA